MACEKCWGDAFMRHWSNPSKSQSDHYRDLLDERRDNPCKLTLDSRMCPHCGTDLLGQAIPGRDQEVFGGATHFQRQIGITNADEDRITIVRCPDCGAEDKR